MRIFRILVFCCFLLGSVLGLQAAQAQSENSVTVIAEPEIEMADTLRQDGKIYVVVIVLLTVVAGMVVYLISLDRKVTRLEKQLKD